MKRSSSIRRAILLVAMLAVLIAALAGCVKTGTTDEFNQFVPPSSDVGGSGSGSTVTGTKVTMSGESAIKMLFDSFVNAQAAAPTASNVLNFSFAPYFSVTKNGRNTTYTIDVQGAINRDDNDKSVFSLEIIKAEDGAEPITVLGVYGRNGNMVIDSRNYETGAMVHQYYVDDMDISLVSHYVSEILNQLDAQELLEKFSVADMLEKTGLSTVIEDMKANGIDLNNFLKLDGSLLDLIFSLVSNNTSSRPEDMCYMIDKGNGLTQLVMPLSINGILENISLVSGMINDMLAGKSATIQTIVNLLFGDILSGRTTLKLYIRADIKNNMFQKAAITVATDGATESEYEIGIGELSASNDSQFANNIVANMPEVAKGDRADYSFTTLSLDLGVKLNVAQHTYTLDSIDYALGGAIAGLLGAVDGQVWKQKEIEIGEGGLTINLLLKLRAEIDLKNNDNTRISLELFGSEDEKLRLGAYYKGADEALYIDTSGMGGGKIKVSGYDVFVLESELAEGEAPYDNKHYVLDADGSYKVRADGTYVKVKRSLNLNKIIAAALDKYIPQIPSLLEIINGKLGISSAAEDSNEEVLGLATLGEISQWISSGDVVVPHYGFSSEKSAVSAADGDVDILGLVMNILGCAVIKKGDTALSLNGLYVYMTQDVIDSIFKDALHLNLPVKTFNIILEQTANEGWDLDIYLELAKDGERLADAEVSLYLNYGNPEADFHNYFDNLPLYDLSAQHTDGFLDADFFSKDDTGALDNINLNLSLETRITFHVDDESVFDFSPLGQLLMNLAIKMKAEDEVDVDLGIKIAANVNAATLIKAIQGKAATADILNAIEARIDIGRYGEDYTIMLYLNKGVLYLDATKWGMPEYKIDLTDAIAGNFKLFGKDTSSAAAAEAETSYVEDTEAKDDTGILGVIFMMLNGVKIDNTALEVELTNRLFSILCGMLGIEWGDTVSEITTNGSNIRIEYDGLNLSKLWVELNVGMQQGEGNNLSASLGLGHIAIGAGNKNLTSDLDFTNYRDVMNGGNVFLGLQLEVDIFLKENTISLDDMLGALIADAGSALDTTININDTINGGLLLTVIADLDLASNSATNDTALLIELRRVSDNSLMLGLYYKHDGINGGKLYLDTTGTVFQPVALDIDLISILGNLISGSSSSALAAEGEASAIDLGGLNPLIILGNRGVQLQVLQGITDILFDLIVGDFNDYIDYENSKKFYEYTPDTAADILAKAEKAEDDSLVLYQKSYDQYVKIGEDFVAYDKTNAAHAGLTIYAKAANKAYFYLKVSDPREPDYKLADDVLVNAMEVKGDSKSYKKYVLNGSTYIEVTAANADQYETAVKYARFKHIPVSMLVKSDEKNIAGYGENGYVPAFNDNLTQYVATQATADDLYLYKIYNGEIATRPNDTSDNPKGMQIRLPELGAVISIGKVVKDGDSHVSVANGNDFGGIGIGIFVWPFDTPVENRTIDNVSANIAIKLGNIMFNDAKFKAAAYNTNNYGLTDYINNVVATRVTKTAEVENLGELTVYVNVEAAIDLSAMANKEDGKPWEWEIGGLLSAVLKTQTAEKPELAAFVKSLLLKLDVPANIGTVIGLRIAGNVKIGKLLTTQKTETLDKVIEMLSESELAIEIYDNYVHAAGAKMVVGLYLENGWLYVNADGSLVSNTKFKIELANVMPIISSIGSTSEALAAADTDIAGILKIVSDAVKSVDINNSASNKSLKVNFGAKLLNVIVGLIADVEGVELPVLNESNSFLELNTTRRVAPGSEGYDAAKDYVLKLSLGIDPLTIAVVLGGFEIGLADDEDVIPGTKPLSEDTEYKTISQLAENVSLNLELGLKATLKEGVLPIGLIVSTIMQELGYDVEFPLDMDLQDDISLDLAIQLKANLNLNDLEKSDIKLAIVNKARETNKTVFGMYFTHETQSGVEVPVVYLETNFSSQNGTVNRWKIDNFNLLDSLLGETLTGVIGMLTDNVSSGSSAVAAEEGPTAAEIILSLQEDKIKLAVSEQFILSLITALMGKDGLSEEMMQVIDDLNAAAEVTVTTGGSEGIGIKVDVFTSYIDLGVAILNPQISLNKFTDVFEGLDFADGSWSQSGIGDYVSGKSALSIGFGMKVEYDVGDGVFGLDSLVKDLASADFLKGSTTLTSIGELLKTLSLDIICQNTRGYIGIDVVINLLSAKMNELLPEVGKMLKDLVMGKLDDNYVVTDSEGNTFNAMSLLGMIEARITVDLNGSKVYVSIAQEDGDTYVYITLAEMGGDNFKMSLTQIIESVGSINDKKSTTSSTALAAAGDGTTTKTTDYALLGKILGNAIASLSISKNNGLDIALAPQIMQVLLTDVIAGLLGDGFKFDDATLDIFTLTAPYVKMGELGEKVRVDDVEYLLLSEERYVRYNKDYKSQEAYLAEMKAAGKTDYAQLYYKDTHAYDAYAGEIFSVYTVAAGTAVALDKLVTDDGKTYVYKEVVAGEGMKYVEYDATVDTGTPALFVLIDGVYMAVTDGKVTFATEKTLTTAQLKTDGKLYVNTAAVGEAPSYALFDPTLHGVDAQLYVLSGNAYIATEYFAAKYVRYADNTVYHVYNGDFNLDNGNYYVNTAAAGETPVYAVYDSAVHAKDAQLYVKQGGEYLPVVTTAVPYVRHSYIKYISAGNVTKDTVRYKLDGENYVEDTAGDATQQFVKVGEEYLPVYYKVKHSGISWSEDAGLGIDLIFADRNGAPGFSFSLGLDATLTIKGVAEDVLPAAADTYSKLDNVATNGMMYLSFVLSLDFTGKDGHFDLGDLLKQLIADNAKFNFSELAALGIFLDVDEFDKEIDIKVTLAANVASLVTALSAKKIDIVSLLQQIELAIEPLYTSADAAAGKIPAGKAVGDAKGGLYLLKGNLYIDYINNERGIFSMNLSDLFAMLGESAEAASYAAAAEDVRTSAAMLQLWIGEYVNFGGIPSTGIAIRLTTSLMEGLLSALLGKPISFADNLGKLEAEITINAGAPKSGDDGAIYAKIVKEKVVTGEGETAVTTYNDIVLAEGASYSYKNVKDADYDPQTAEGYNAAYDLVKRYVKIGDKYELQKYNFSLDSFAIGVAINAGTLGIGLSIGHFDIGIAYNTGDANPYKVIPDEVKNYAVPEEAVIDLGLNIEIGLIMTEGDKKFDLGAFIDNTGLFGTTKLGKDWLLISVPSIENPGQHGSAEIRLVLGIALSLNLTNIDKSVAMITLVGQSYNPDGYMGETQLATIYFKDGDLLIDLEGLGFGKIKLTGLRLSNLLGTNSGFELIKGLLKKSDAGSSALAAEDPAATITISEGLIAANITSKLFNKLFDMLIAPKYVEAADGLYVMLNNEYVLYDVANPAHTGLKRYTKDESTKNLLQSLDISAILEITTKPFEIRLAAKIAELIGVNVAINNVKIGNTGVEALVAPINSNDYIEAARINFTKDENNKTKADLDVLIDTVSINLQIDLNALFSDGMFVGDQVAVGSVGNDLVGITAYVKADIAVAALMSIINSGIDKNDTAALLSQILPMITAQISIVRADDPTHEILGIYLINGDVILKLDGMGMPNIRISNEFLLEIIGAVASDSSALAAADATKEPSTGDKILAALPQLIQGVYLVQKSVRIALTNDYFVILLDTLMFGGSRYYQDVMPEPGENNPDTALNNNFSGLIINFNNLFGDTREGLLQVDLDMYSTHLNLDVYMPLIKFNDTENRISLPDGFIADTVIESGTDKIDLSLTLAGQLKIDKNEGVALANIMSSIVGDLETSLVIAEDLDLRFSISASASLAFSFAEKTFNIAALDLQIRLAKMVDNVATDLAVIYYNSADEALYLDLSYFFQNQYVEEVASTHNLGKLKITGVDIVGLLGGLIGGSASEALAAAGDTGAWVPATNNTKIYSPATAANTAAPATYVLVNKVDAGTGNPVTAYNRITVDAANVYVKVGEDYVAYDSANAAHTDLQGYAKVGDNYVALYVKDGGKYVAYVCSNLAFRYKAKYTLDTLTEFVPYDSTLHAGMVTYVKVYRPSTCSYEYVASTDGNYAALAAAPTVYIKDASGAYVNYTGSDAKYVIDYVAYDDTLHSGLERYKQTVAEDGTVSYTKDAAGGFVRYYTPYDPANANHAKKGLYIKNGDAYEELYIKSSIYGLSAVWAVVQEGSNTASVYITGKAMLGLIGKFVNNAQLADILDSLRITINASRSPFVFGADISILDRYNDYKPALSLHLNLFGFDYPDGSSLEFAYNELRPADSGNYRNFLDVDLDKILNAADIMDVLIDSLKFGGSADGKLYLNATISMDAIANATGTDPVDWTPFIANILGLSESDVKVLLDVYYGDGIAADTSNLSIDISASIDVKNLIGGLVDGTGLNLDGTEIQLAISMDTPHFAESIRGNKIYITIIGKDTDGLTGIYVDLTGWRGKGKHKLSLDLATLLGDSIGSASGALAAADVETGLIPENVFNILNTIIGEIRLGDGKISVGLKETFLGDILNTFAGLNIDKTKSLLTGDVYIDVRHLGLGANIYIGNVVTDPVTGEKTPDVGIALNIGKINLAPSDKLVNGTFIPEASKSEYKNILDLVLDIDMEIEYQFDGAATNETTNPPIDLSSLLNLLGTLLGKELFANPNFLIKADEAIDAVYTFKVNAHIDLGQLFGRKTLSKDGIQVVFEMWRQRKSDATSEKRLGLYLDGENIYVDLSPLGLPKLAVTNLNLGEILKNALSGVGEKLGATASRSGSSALAAAEDVADEAFKAKWGNTLLSGAAYPYFTLVFRPNAFAFGLNNDLLNSLFETLGNAIGLNLEFPDIGDMAFIFDSSSGDLRPSFVARVSSEFYFKIGLSDLHINGNMSSTPAWETAATRFANNVYGNESQYSEVYNVKTGEIGLGRVNVGMDITIRQDGYNSNPSMSNYGSSFEFYLWALLSGLLGKDDLGINFNIGNGTDVVGYDISLRASINIGSIVRALSGNVDIAANGAVGWWNDIELYLTVKPNNTTTFLGGSYGTLLSAYKQSGSADLYVDLNGLSLPKIKIVGLSNLVSGLVSATSSALAAEDGATAAATEKSNLTISVKQNGVRIDIGMGIVDGILGLLGDTLTVGQKTYTHDFKYGGSSYNHSVTLKTITIGTTTIPIPILSSTKALSLELTYPSAEKGISLGIDVGLGLDNLGNNVKIGIDNFVLSTDSQYYDGTNHSKYVMYGATNGKINTTGTSVFNDITGTNANSFSGLIMNDAYGVSIYNILANVFGGIDPNISITWNKNTTFNWQGTNTVGNVDDSDKKSGAKNTVIKLSRTTTSTQTNRGKDVYAGKVEAYLDFTTVNRQVGVWLFNNHVYIDISALAKGLDLLLGALGYDQYKVTDLDLLALITGSSAEAGASDALAAEEEATASAGEETTNSTLDTIKGIIAGIDINWWYNVTDSGKAQGNQDISSLRINLNADGLNDLLTKVYYMIYTMYDAEAGKTLTKEDFAKLSYTTRYNIVTGNRGGTYTDPATGTVYNTYDVVDDCVYYLHAYLSDMLAGLIGSTIGNMLKPGGAANAILKDILGSLLPIPFLDGNKANYIEVVLDKSKINSTGVISEIGIYLNKEKVTLNGVGNNPTRNTLGDSNYPQAMELIITLGNQIELRSVSDVRAYDTTKSNFDDEATVPSTSATTVYVQNPFDPEELSSASLTGNSNLLQKVDAKFYGITDYTSKSQNGQGTNDLAILGGTRIIWDTSTVDLTPGATSKMTGYALNYAVQTVNVTVSPLTGFSRLYGYVDANGKFVSASRIVVDPTKDPYRTLAEGETPTVAALPNIIVILRRDGELQVLDTDYKATSTKTVTVDGLARKIDGKFGWNEPTSAVIKNGGTTAVDFWYQVGSSWRIKKSITVTYNNSSIASGILPSNDVFGILNGGDAGNFTNANIDVIGNLGLNGNVTAASVKEVTAKDGSKYIACTMLDGSVVKFTKLDVALTPEEQADTEVHAAGFNGTFIRYNGDKVLQSGTYKYVPASAASAAGGILDSITGLFGGSDKTATDKGSYALTVTSAGYTWLNSIDVVLANGSKSNVEVLGWDFSDLEYDITHPEKGVKGSVKAIVNNYESKLEAGAIDHTIVNSKQTVKIDVAVTRHQLAGFTAGPNSNKSINIAFNRYSDLFVEDTAGAYVLQTVTSSETNTDGSNKTYTGFVLYDETLHAGQKRYSQNFLTAEEIYVRVNYSALGSRVYEFNKENFTFYTNVVALKDGGSVRMFVAPSLKSSTEMKISVTASFVDGYEQTFGFKIAITRKTASKAVILISRSDVASLTGGNGVATVIFSDNTSAENIEVKDIMFKDAEGKDVITITGEGIYTTTATVYKRDASVLDTNEAVGFTQKNVKLEIRVY